ncbi:hypothetical protein ACSQPN_006350, partial [Pseudomonas aeruginosa]
LTPEYEGQWHADFYLDREIPLAKAEGATPAEAVLALMSAERIDPEQESVEQAGGDERAAFEAWLAQAMSKKFDPEFDLAKYEDSGEYRYSPAAAYWKAWQARAALAQPSSANCETEWSRFDPFFVVDHIRRNTIFDADLVGRMLDFAIKNGPSAQPSPVQAEQTEQAEAERPEVVARVVHSNPVVLGQCGPLNANDELMTVAQHAASVARWAEMFNRVEQERDAALARVAELEKLQQVDEHVIEHLSLQTDIAESNASSRRAQAQHSVPEEVRTLLSRAQCEIEHLAECLENVCEDEEDFDVREDVADGRVVAADIAHMLAAAPGKEVGHE